MGVHGTVLLRRRVLCIGTLAVLVTVLLCTLQLSGHEDSALRVEVLSVVAAWNRVCLSRIVTRRLVGELTVGIRYRGRIRTSRSHLMLRGRVHCLRSLEGWISALEISWSPALV
jgi:hypothetical protein